MWSRASRVGSRAAAAWLFTSLTGDVEKCGMGNEGGALCVSTGPGLCVCVCVCMYVCVRMYA